MPGAPPRLASWTVLLQSERLTLRPFVAEDAADLHAYLSREEAVEYEPYGVATARECADLAVERAADERFLAVQLTDGPVIGNVFHAPEGVAAWDTWTVGYVLHPDHWGCGYASEAVRRLLAHLFDERGAHRVVARCDPRNARSWRLLDRVGMRREAHVLQGASFGVGPDGRPVWHDTYQYALLGSERSPRT